MMALVLPSEIMIGGELTSEAAAIIRHILYSHPNIGWASFLRLFNEFFVLLNGRAATQNEFPSMATIRNHILRLDIFDEHEVRESIKVFAKKLSPRGNRVFFGGGGDGTCHGKADKREVCVIVTGNDDYRHPTNEWHIDPDFYVTTASSPVGSDSNANATHYVNSIGKVVPPKEGSSLLVFSIDNCNTAHKDSRLTLKGSQDRAIEHGHEDMTMAHGVIIRCFPIGDPFHRFQLSVKWMSETACGKTEKGCHEQIHHRQVSFFYSPISHPVDCCVVLIRS